MRREAFPKGINFINNGKDSEGTPSPPIAEVRGGLWMEVGLGEGDRPQGQ